MQGMDGNEEDVFLDALRVAFRGGPDAVRSHAMQDSPQMTRAAWDALSDPDASLLGDDLPDLDAEDGSTVWTVGVERLSAEYGPGLVARIDVPAFGSGEPYRVVLTENEAAVFEGISRDTLDAMQQADEHAEALGWPRGPASPAAAP